MASTLSPQAVNAWNFIAEYLDAHGFAPTMREIAAACGVTVGDSVTYLLNALEAKAVISRERGARRGIVLLRQPPARHPRYWVEETAQGTTCRLADHALLYSDARVLFDDRALYYGRDRRCILHMRQGEFDHVEARRDDGALIAQLDLIEAGADHSAAHNTGESDHA
jgi:hypothetical protein